jgi:hypothetical protein
MYTLDEMRKTSKDFGNKRIWMSRWVVASFINTGVELGTLMLGTQYNLC